VTGDGAGILVVRGGAVGDFILTLPVLSALRSRFPDSRIEVLAQPRLAALAVAGGLADGVRSLEDRALAGFFACGTHLDPDWVQYFSRFRTIISFLHDPERIFQENVGRCSKAQFISGPHRPDEAEAIHATRVLLKPLEQLSIFDADPTPQLTIPLSAEVSIPTGDWLALHPGSGSERKNWPVEKWRRLIEALIEKAGWNLLLVGGEAERDRLQDLGKDIPAARLQFAEELPLPTLATYLQLCRGFVGHDSGITHLAAAAGLPCVVLWGPSSAEVWRPLGEKVRIVQSTHGISGISEQEILKRIHEQFGQPKTS
jgi:heptosyltransferase-2